MKKQPENSPYTNVMCFEASAYEPKEPLVSGLYNHIADAQAI